jgi:hypothetical protein
MSQQVNPLLRWAVGAVMLTALIAASTAFAATALLKVTVPASVPAATPVTVTASGQAGRYNTVATIGVRATCPAKVPTTYNTKTVKPNHTFKVKLKLSIPPANGTYRACVYLYNGANPHGSNIHKSKPFQVA